MSTELIFEAEPFQGYTEFDEFESDEFESDELEFDELEFEFDDSTQLAREAPEGWAGEFGFGRFRRQQAGKSGGKAGTAGKAARSGSRFGRFARSGGGAAPGPAGGVTQGASPQKTPALLQAAQVKTVRIVVKSYIAYIGNRVGRTRCAPPALDTRLAILAKTTDAAFNENPRNDVKDAKYRLYSALTIRVAVKDGQIVGFEPSPVEKGVGLECIPGFQKACLMPPPLTVSNEKGWGKNEHVRRIQPNALEFSWMGLGRPAVEAEPAFKAVCDRTSIYIWHKIKGTIESSAQGVKLSLWLYGSLFPSHRIFVNGKNVGTIQQDVFSSLWTPYVLDKNLVTQGKPAQIEMLLK